MISPHRIWTGLNASQEGEAFPNPNRETAPVRRLEIVGRWTALSQEGFWWALRNARKDPAVKLVELFIDSGISTWNVSYAIEAVQQLSSEKLTAAYIRNAIGSTLALAACCRAVYAHPHATIGGLASFSHQQLHEDVQVALNAETLRLLHKIRPATNWQAWGPLLFNVVNGPAAEQLGVVDFLANSEAAMLARFKIGRESTR